MFQQDADDWQIASRSRLQLKKLGMSKVGLFLQSVTLSGRPVFDDCNGQVVSRKAWCSSACTSAGKTVKEDCLIELAAFQADLTTNVNKDIPLGKPCCCD